MLRVKHGLSFLLLLLLLGNIADAATRKYTGNAITTAQVNTITPGGTIVIGDVFTVTINNKAVPYTATGSTVAGATAGLVASLTASTVPQEFKEVTWTDQTTYVKAVAVTAGKPFTNTSGASGSGTSTCVTAIATANSGPSDVSIAANWSSNTLPVSNDTILLEYLTTDLLYGLDQHTVTGITVIVDATYGGRIGLPFTNSDAPTTYSEYRPQYLQYGATSITFAGTSTRAKFDIGSSTATITVNNTGVSSESGVPTLLLRGGTCSGLNVNKGSVGVGLFSGDAVTFSSGINVGYLTAPASDAFVHLGRQCTTTAAGLIMNGGTAIVDTTISSVELDNQAAIVYQNAAVTTQILNNAGTVFYSGTGTITLYNGGDHSVLDFRRDLNARTVTTAKLYPGASIFDGKGATVTWTNGIGLIGAGIEDVTIQGGKGITVTIN